MEYKHIVEEREFKFGPGEKLKNIEEAREKVRNVRQKIITELSLARFYEALQDVKEDEEQNLIRLKFIIKVPIKLFD